MNSFNKTNEQENLVYIRQIIEQAKGNLRKGNGKFFLLWGYIVTIASLTHYLLFYFTDKTDGYSLYIWPIAIVAGVIITVILAVQDKNKKRVKTYVGYMISRIWLAFGLGVLLIYITFTNEYALFIYPAISFVYTLALFLSASAFKLKWMYIPVAICFICVLSYTFIPAIYQPLIMAFMLICGNIVPGQILNHKGRNNV